MALSKIPELPPFQYCGSDENQIYKTKLAKQVPQKSYKSQFLLWIAQAGEK